MKKTFVDSNIFIYLLQAHETYGAKSREFFEKVQAGDAKAFTSSLNMVEVMEVLRKYEGTDKASKLTFELFKLPIDVLKVSTAEVIKAIELQEKYDIDSFDCIALSLMEKHGIGTIFTNDGHFDIATEIRAIRPE